MYTNTYMIFNDIDFSSYFVVEEVKREFLPSINNSYIKSHHIKTELSPTIISVKIRLIQSDDYNLTETKREIAGKLYTDKPAKLLLYDDPSRYDIAKLDGSTDFSKLWTTGSATLKFINAEGVSYSGSARTMPIGTILVDGTWKTKPVFTVTFTGSATTYKVSNVTTGKHVEITGQNFVAGNVLVIDCLNENVKLNGNPIMPKVTINSDFFVLVPGTNVLTGAGNVTFNEAWL